MSSNYPNGFAAGVSIRGLPLTMTNPGEVFWVNSTSVLAKGGVGASNGNDGSYRRPFSTITYALTKCTASRGDIIVVMPGYTETVAAAGGLAVNVAGVAIVGLGSGSLKPTVTLATAVGASVTVTAANTSFFNIRFVSGLANITNAVSVTAAHAAFDSCEWMASAAGTGMNISLLTSALATGLSVTNSTINMESSIAGVPVTDIPTEAIRLVGCDNAVIKGNFIVGNFSTSAINGITTASEAILIANNQIHNVDTAAAAGGIDLVAACTGMVSSNHVGAYETTAIATTIDNSSCSNVNNLVTNVVTEIGGLPGTASA
jgi:hypothetical protein